MINKVKAYRVWYAIKEDEESSTIMREIDQNHTRADTDVQSGRHRYLSYYNCIWEGGAKKIYLKK